MLIKTGHKKAFSLGGTIAAIMDEKAWGKMLNGERLCILEPDDTRWTLILETHPIDVVRADSAQSATEVFMNRNAPFAIACRLIADGKEPAARWKLKQGFPNYLECTPEQREAHVKAGRTDATKIAAFYRVLVEKQAKKVLSEEIGRHSTRYEGRD